MHTCRSATVILLCVMARLAIFTAPFTSGGHPRNVLSPPDGAVWSKALAAAGVDRVFVERAGGHDRMVWREEIAAALVWILAEE